MKYLHFQGYLILAAVMMYKVHCQPARFQPAVSSACYGQSSPATTLNASCTDGHVLAIGDVTMGAKPVSTGCPLTYNSSYNYDECCTKDENDCTFPLYSENVQYHNQCNGKPECPLGVQNQFIGDYCDQLNGTFGVGGYSTYMLLEFYCVEDDKMVEMCSGLNSPLTNDSTELYIWNRNFPYSDILPTDSSCNCSVEVDNCQAGIKIYTMYRLLTGDEDGVCNQTLRVLNDATVLLEWSCNDNKRDFETHTVQETYIVISLENLRNETGGKIWLGFQGTSDSNVTVSCPPLTQQFCMSTTTTTTTEGTTTITTTTEPTTTMNETTPEPNTTVSVTTEPASTTDLGSTSTTTTFTTGNTSTPTPTINITETTTTSTTTTLQTTTLNDSSTESTTKTNKDETEKILLLVVIVLGTLVGLLMIIITVLCCLRQKRLQTENDAEKESPQSPHLDAKEADFKTVPENISPIVFPSGNNPIELTDSGCQVSLAPLKVKTVDFQCQVAPKTDKKANMTSSVQLMHKETYTEPLPRSHSSCQSDAVRKKNQEIQTSLYIKTHQATASCQTDATVEQQNSIPSSALTSLIKVDQLPKNVQNGTVPKPTVSKEKTQENKTVPTSTDEVEQKTDDHRQRPRNRKHRKHKKRGINESKGNRDVTDNEHCEEPDGNVRIIHVDPGDTVPNISKVKHVLSVRSTIANSFFEQERLEKKMYRFINKNIKGQKNRKTLRRSHSEC